MSSCQINLITLQADLIQKKLGRSDGGWIRFCRNIYHRYLVRVLVIRIFYRTLFRLSSSCKTTIAKLRARSTYKITSLWNFCYYEICEVHEFYKSELLGINQPKVYPAQQTATVQLGQVFYSIPKTFLAVIDNGNVIGGSNIFIAGSCVVLHDMFDPASDTTSEELHQKVIFDINKSKISFCHPVEPILTLDTAAVFLDATSKNYAHWLTEVLPRIAIFCSNSEYKDIPILIDSGLHNNILRSLEIVVGNKRKVYAVIPGTSIKVKRLYCMSHVGYVPFGPRKGFSDNHTDGLFNPIAIRRVRDVVESRLLIDQSKQLSISEERPTRIYLRRRSGSRKLINHEEVEVLLSNFGFLTVEPENYTFDEQVRLFSDAKYVISATGAALTNCVFCTPGTKVGVLMAKHPDMIYKYWLNMLDPLGIDVSYVLCDSHLMQSAGIHNDFTVNINDVHDMVNEWLD